MLKIKDRSINRAVMTPEMRRVELVMEVLFEALGYYAMVTSANDGQHMAGSLHFKDQARDFRTHHLRAEDKGRVKDMARRVLGPSYDIVLESLNLLNEHLHIEYDPRPSS